jgi:dipeptidase E
VSNGIFSQITFFSRILFRVGESNDQSILLVTCWHIIARMVKAAHASVSRAYGSSSSSTFGAIQAIAPALGGFRRIVAAGRGRVIQSPPVRTEILRLARKSVGKSVQLRVVYIGTATFDRQDAFDVQAKGFADDCGCIVDRLELTDLAQARKNLKSITELIEKAHIIAVSGGNTLFAMTRWRRLGVDGMLRRAMERGAVLCGGSAGAICWFEGGHSDSRDPTTTLRVRPE